MCLLGKPSARRACHHHSAHALPACTAAAFAGFARRAGSGRALRHCGACWRAPACRPGVHDHSSVLCWTFRAPLWRGSSACLPRCRAPPRCSVPAPRTGTRPATRRRPPNPNYTSTRYLAAPTPLRTRPGAPLGMAFTRYHCPSTRRARQGQQAPPPATTHPSPRAPPHHSALTAAPAVPSAWVLGLGATPTSA